MDNSTEVMSVIQGQHIPSTDNLDQPSITQNSLMQMKPESYAKGQSSRYTSEKLEQKQLRDALKTTFQTKQNNIAELASANQKQYIRTDVPIYQTNAQLPRPSSTSSVEPADIFEEYKDLSAGQKRRIKTMVDKGVDQGKAMRWETEHCRKASHALNSSEIENEEKILPATFKNHNNPPEHDCNKASVAVREQSPLRTDVPFYQTKIRTPEFRGLEILKGRDHFSTNQRRRINAMIKDGVPAETAKLMERARHSELMMSRSLLTENKVANSCAETLDGQHQLEFFTGEQKRRIRALIKNGIEPEKAKHLERERYVKNAVYRSSQGSFDRGFVQKQPDQTMEYPMCGKNTVLEGQRIVLSRLSIAENILDLIDDCLMIICQKLELRDQIRFAMTCQKFYNVYLTYCSPKEVIISELDNNLSFVEKRYFFEIAGPNIKSFTATNTSIWKKCEKRVFNHIFKCTPNIESICLSSTSIGSRCLHTLCRSIQNLISVDLSWCKLCDEDIWVLQKLINLEILKLEGNPRITGKNMQAHRKLKVINFRDCSKIEFRYFKALCKSNINIHTVNIQSCYKLGEINAELVKVFHNLQSLAITCRENGTEEVCMPELRDLRNLRVEYTTRTELWMALAEQKLEQIEYLAISALGPDIDMELLTRFTGIKTLYISSLYFGLTDDHLEQLLKLPNLERLSIIDSIKRDEITNAALLNLFTNCIKLREISLITVFNLTNEFIFAVINVLKNCKYELEKKILLHVWQGCEISESILKDPRYLAAKLFFKLDFEPHIRGATFQWSGII